MYKCYQACDIYVLVNFCVFLLYFGVLLLCLRLSRPIYVSVPEEINCLSSRSGFSCCCCVVFDSKMKTSGAETHARTHTHKSILCLPHICFSFKLNYVSCFLSNQTFSVVLDLIGCWLKPDYLIYMNMIQL